MAKSRARKLADIIVGAGIDIDGNLTFDGGSTSADLTFADNDKANFGDASDLQIYHSGNESWIKDSGSGNLYIDTNGAAIQLTSNNTAKNMVVGVAGGGVTLYHNNSAKLATTSSGVTVTGGLVATSTSQFTDINIPDNNAARFGDSQEFQIYHTGSGNSIISETGSGSLYLDATNIYLRKSTASGETMGAFVADGAATLYYDNSAKLATASTGIDVTGSIDVTSSASYGVTANRGFKSTADIPNFTLVESDASGQTWQINSTGAKLSFRDISRQLDRIVIDTAGNVGIGTTAPTARLDVRSANGGVHSRGQLYLTNTDSHAINQGSQISLGGTYSGTSDTYLGSIAARKENATSGDYAGYLQFGTRPSGSANVERMRITSAGNVGIGTTSPASKLHIRNTASEDTAIILENTNNAQNLNIDYYNNAGAVQSRINYAEGPAAWNFIPNTSNNNSALYINYSANVGIGTTSPGTKLHVTGTTTFDGDGASRAEITSSTANSVVSLDVGGFTGTPSVARDVRFLTNVASNNKSERMRITSGGNVGIGTTSPTGAKLHVAGAIKGTDLIAHDSTGINLQTDEGTKRLVVTDAGNIGIGTTSPSAKLDVSGTTNITSSTSMLLTLNPTANNYGGILYQYGGATKGSAIYNSGMMNFGGESEVSTVLQAGGQYGLFIHHSTRNVGIGTGAAAPGQKLTVGSGHIKLDEGYSLQWSDSYERIEQSDGHLEFFVNNGESMTLDTYGLGIGTTAPATRAHIQGSNAVTASTGLLYITADSAAQNNGGQISLGTSSARHAAIAGRQESTGGSAGYLQLSTRGSSGDITEAMRIDSSGQLLLGRSANVASGAEATRIQFYNTNSTYDIASIRAEIGAGQVNRGELAFAVNNGAGQQEAVRIDRLGNVGIGTSSPSYPLDVRGNVRIGDGSSTEQDIEFVASTGSWQVGTNNQGNGTSSNHFYIYDNAYRLTVQKGTGNVGIGTTSPFAKLQVAGSELFMHGGTTTTGPGIFLGDNNFANSSYYNSAPGIGAVGPYGGVTAGLAFYVYGSQANSRNEAMRIDSSGSVGIGTTSPTSKLTVNTGASGNTATFSSGAATSGNHSGITINAYNISGVAWYGSEIRNILTASAPSYLNPRLGFFTQDNNTHLPADRTEKMSILGNGNVGIGTDSPAGRLHLRDTTPHLYIQSDDGQSAKLLFGDATDNSRGGIEYMSTDDMQFMNNNLSTVMTLRYTGQVGIGETNPNQDAAVEIAKAAPNTGVTTLRLTNSVNNKGQRIDFEDDNAARAFTLSHDNGSNFTYMGTLVNEPFVFYTNSTERMRITSSGIVKGSDSEFLGFEDAINILNADPEDGGSDFDQTPTNNADGGQTYWSISNDGDAIYFSSTSGGHSGTWMKVYCDAGLWAIKGSVRLTNTDGAVHGSTSTDNYKFTHSFRFYISSGPDTGNLKWDADAAASNTGTDFTRAAFSTSPVYMSGGYKTITYHTNGYEGVQQIYITDLQLVKVG